MAKKVLLVVPTNDFRDPEYFEPKNVLESNGIQVFTSANGTIAQGADGGTASVDVQLKDAKAEDYDAIVFIGGPGSSEYFNDKKAQQIIRDAASSGKVVAAICAAVATIANTKVLKGKKATSFPGVSATVRLGGAEYTGEKVTIDGKFITADGPGSAKAFGEAIAKALNV